MGRFRTVDYNLSSHCIFDGAEWFADAANNAHAKKLVEQFDAYEARIAELTAELARVKAESLRVVPDGEAFDIDDLPGWEHIINDLYTHDGRTYINIDDERCCKVRLERWETEDGN